MAADGGDTTGPIVDALAKSEDADDKKDGEVDVFQDTELRYLGYVGRASKILATKVRYMGYSRYASTNVDVISMVIPVEASYTNQDVIFCMPLTQLACPSPCVTIHVYIVIHSDVGESLRPVIDAKYVRVTET